MKISLGMLKLLLLLLHPLVKFISIVIAASFKETISQRP
jgi:hypothetical protein